MPELEKKNAPCLGLAGSLFLLTLFCLAPDAKAGGGIRHASFEDFSAGTLGNSGANLYVSRKGRVQVINHWDLNQDGWADLVMSNSHDIMETVDALVYWGSEKGPQSLLPPLWKQRPLAQVLFRLLDEKGGVTRLPSFGGGRSAIADFNRDGHPDIVFCNFIHNYPGVRYAYIYWGSRDGYLPGHRTELPTNWASGVEAADLNQDGYPDLIFANQGVELGLESISPERGLASFIYWGGPSGFDSAKPELVATRGAADVRAANLDGDGRPDLVFVNASSHAQEIQFFLGGAGYGKDSSHRLPLPEPTSVSVCDLDRDGKDDLVVTGALAGGEADGQEPNAEIRRLYLLFGSSSGIDPQRTLELPSHLSQGTFCGDLNGDDWPDLAVASLSDHSVPRDQGWASNFRVPSFVYWGSERGFSREGRSQLPTLGASDVDAADLNRDGFVDLIFANSRDGSSYDVPSYVYWGSQRGFAPYLRSDLQSFGAGSVQVEDLDGDGNQEVLLVNQTSGTHSGTGTVESHIFWGNSHSFYSTASVTGLLGNNAYGVTLSDFNDDGFVDLLLCNNNIDFAHLYWGDASGFSQQRRDSLPAGPAPASSAADLNRDGHLDLVFTHSHQQEPRAVILWGSNEVYSGTRRTTLKLAVMTASHRVADLNRDGWLDLIFPSRSGDLQISWGSPDGYSESGVWTGRVGAGQVELADLDADGHLDFVITGTFDPETRSRNTHTRIYRGTPEGVPEPNPIAKLQAYAAIECAIADLNRDGFLDLALSNYMSDSTRSLPLFVYWGREGARYSDQNRTDLPAESSSGVQTLDLNRDGFPEVIVHNHVKDGIHTIDSYIYWNGPEGLSLERRTLLPTIGTHFSPRIDPGNLYTRRLEEEYISAPLSLPNGEESYTLSWRGEEPQGTQLELQVRSAQTRDGLHGALWRGPSGEASFYDSPGPLPGPGEQRWIQYRVVFTSADGGAWPVLQEVEIAALPSQASR